MELYEGICHDVDDDKLLKLLQDKSVELNMSLKYVYSADTELRGLWRLDGQSDRFSDESGYHAGSFSYGKALPVEGRFGEGRHIEGRGIELGKTGLGLSGNTYSFWFSTWIYKECLSIFYQSIIKELIINSLEKTCC